VEVAILVGLQASGKTAFCGQRLGGHAHVSKDHFPNARHRQRRQLRLIDEALAAGRDLAVDNTNPRSDLTTEVGFTLPAPSSALPRRPALSDLARRPPVAGTGAGTRRRRRARR
jgi:hypothetical protein